MPTTRTPRELLLAALQHRRLTGYRASQDQAWVVFPPQSEGGTTVQVVHLARLRRFRVVSSETDPASTIEPTTLGEFKDSGEAAACVEDALKGGTGGSGGRLRGKARAVSGVNGTAAAPHVEVAR